MSSKTDPRERTHFRDSLHGAGVNPDEVRRVGSSIEGHEEQHALI
eukprot:CAMPEP_0204035750 /NCGR_PEP_ID=MMETSP0360-20130528/77342_1 /ASSEMBLY_ACC=CAM_ASM_000342 /TAXON_ID=268821 /ORGANISM="Scrippsiella Hangoei, Strain SHTV-5" /LENGTH=44 /DNA_ID= /DNA_START= /DNA_END= /DNA_ORIENTATION=